MTAYAVVSRRDGGGEHMGWQTASAPAADVHNHMHTCSKRVPSCMRVCSNSQELFEGRVVLQHLRQRHSALRADGIAPQAVKTV